MLLALVFGRVLPSDRIVAIFAVHRVTHAERLERYERRSDKLGLLGGTSSGGFAHADDIIESTDEGIEEQPAR